LIVITLNIKLSHKTLTLYATNGLSATNDLTCFFTNLLNITNNRTLYTLSIQVLDFIHIPLSLGAYRFLHSKSLPIRYSELTFQNTIPFYIIIQFQQRLLPTLQVKHIYFWTLHFRICEASSTTHPTLSENSILLLTLHCIPRGIKL